MQSASAAAHSTRWPRKARCCGGTITLEAATNPPDKVFRRVGAVGIDVFVPVGMMEPESLHVEISRRGRIRAFWNGLAWGRGFRCLSFDISAESRPRSPSSAGTPRRSTRGTPPGQTMTRLAQYAETGEANPVFA